MPYNYKTEIQRYKRYYQNLEPILKKPQNKAYTTIIFSFLAISLFGWYAIRPTIQTILFLQREIQDKTELNKKMENKIAALIEAQANYQEIENKIPAVNQSLPESPQPAELLLQLRNLASASGSTLASLQMPTVPFLGQVATPGAARVQSKTDAAKATVKQGDVQSSVAVRGTYQSLRSYIDGLTNMRRIVWVDSMTLTPTRNESIVGTQSAQPTGEFLQLVLKIKGYYLVP